MKNQGRNRMIDREMEEIFSKGVFRGEVKFDEPMAGHTSLRIGGPADIMVFPEDPQSLKNVLLTAKDRNIPVTAIGGGTNLLIANGGVEGIAVSLNAFNSIDYTEESSGDDIVLYAGAGTPLALLVNFARKNGYSGIEALAGIPGLLGGAVCMNAGSFGTEIKDVIVSVSVMNMQGDIENPDRDRIAFSYRNSNLPEGTFVLGAKITLRKGDPEEVAGRTGEYLERKKATQPLAGLSAGCVFKNPEGDFAGRLIDAAGCKGLRAGDMEVSSLHANYFINRGSALSSDFIELMETVRSRVRECSGVRLEPEIKILGSLTGETGS